MNDCQQHAAWLNGSAGRCKKIALEVVADGDQIPLRVPQNRSIRLQISQLGSNWELPSPCFAAQNLNGRSRTIDCRYIPAPGGQPDRVAAGPTSQIERAANWQVDSGPSDKRGGRLVSCVRHLRLISFVPASNVHSEMVAAIGLNRTMIFPTEPLTGRIVQLQPLRMQHLYQLEAVAFDPELWRWTTSSIRTREDLEAYISKALRERDEGMAFPFAIVELGTRQAVGSTRFANIDGVNRRVEIGWSFVGAPWQRTGVNTETKYLLLRYAFEELGCIRVELKTDALNSKSRDAILRIGATEEGTFRNHMVMTDGRIRDTVYFSILHSEWPAVGENLRAKMR